jgi:DNA-binding HxlR family transcriptional regulator
MKKNRSLCPVNLMIEVVGNKWSLLILRDIIFENKRHFNELRQSEEKIASNILVDRLNKLESDGLISKRADSNHKQKVIYSLTEKGIDLLPVILEIMIWSLKYEPVDRDKYEPAVNLVASGLEGRITLRNELLRDHLLLEP